MKYFLVLFAIAVLGASLALPQSASSPKKAPGVKTITKTPGAKTGASKARVSTSKKGKSLKKSGTAAATTWRNRQMAPTADRYKDIQQALVTRGYLKSEPNGIWDAQSVDALKQFQTDQKLTPTGRISSQSLIGLGLGPKTSGVPAASTLQDQQPALATAIPSAEN